MGKALGSGTYNNFIKGLITEATEINFPPGASLDEDNMVLFRKGNRRRRLGVDYVSGASLTGGSLPLPDSSTGGNFSYYFWKGVGGNGTINFLVFQIASTLYFYDHLTLSQLGTVDLTTRKISGATDVERDKVKMVNLRGRLFVVGKKLTPFFVSYSAGVFTSTAISIKIRDFDGVTDTVASTSERPAALTAAHNYNLTNQGWNATTAGVDPISVYQAATGEYPSNAQVWFIGKDGSDVFTPSLLDKQEFGNTPSAKGHWVLDPFNKDRSTVSGVATIAVESVPSRPQCVEAFAGRVWYAGVEEDKLNGDVYYSQVVDNNISNAGECLQRADPTAEDDSALVEDDGGVIHIANCGIIKAIKAVQDSIFVFADNGVWAISGPNGFFKADDFTLYQITTTGIVSKDSIVDIEGKVIYWSSKGIYAITKPDLAERFIATSLTDLTIQTLYDSIEDGQKNNVQTIYDEKRRQVVWLYNDLMSDISYRRNKVLLLDLTTQAFSAYSIKPLATTSPYIIGGIDFDNTTNWYDSSIAFLTIVPNVGLYHFTFSQFKNTDFRDWYSKDSTGVSFDSFLETGYEYAGDIMRDKSIIFLFCYFQRTEDEWVADNGGYNLAKPSSCLLRTKWEWTDTESSNRWSSEIQAYRIKRLQLPDTNDLTYSDGFPVVITKNKIRGKGRALRYRFSSEEGKDFNLFGWAAGYTGTTAV